MNKKVIHTVFENTVHEKYNNIAIETENKNITYGELNIQANHIAHVLEYLHIEKEDIVATFFDDVLTQLFSLLGIFKSAAIYLPLDKKYKQNHWEELFTSIKPKAILISGENFEILKKYAAFYEYSIPSVVVVSRNTQAGIDFSILRYSGDYYVKDNGVYDIQSINPEKDIDGNNASYIFFTSGSTGRPKAVLGNHKSLSHFIHWESKELSITEKDRIGQFTSLSFDASLRDVFVALMNGGTICIPPKQVKESIQKLSDWVAHKEITVLHTIPTMMRLLISGNTENNIEQDIKFPTLRYLLLAGEKLYNRDIINWRTSFGDNTTLINLYGATESTLVKTFYRVQDELKGDPSDVLSVGQPISNTGILILNTEQEICEVDEVGEVYIKTPFLSKGYFNNEVQTADKFVQNPLSLEKDIIYKTGDYGTYDVNRNITILGRNDGVVKNNGVRIDLNYIESVILTVDDVRMIKCFLLEGTNSETVLYACYTSHIDKTECIRAFCSKRLSNYETPTVFIHFDEFPINSNGKVDVNALKTEATYFTGNSGKIYEPTNDIEKQLVSIWKNVLSVKSISIEDNFLYLGGDSIKLIKLKSQIHKVFDVEINLNDLFDNSILKEQASLIEGTNKSYYSNINKTPEQSSYPLSFAQNRLWTVSQFEEAAIAYNMPAQIHINEECDFKTLEKSIKLTIERHEILRTVFKENKDGNIAQWILPIENIEFQLQYENYEDFDNPEECAAKYIEEDSYLPFDLNNGPLLRASLLQLKENHYVFYYNMHHIICDGVSKEILKRDILAYYEAYTKDEKVNLPSLQIQYKDYASWQIEAINKKESNVHRDFWLNKLSGELPVLNLQTQKSRPNLKSYNGHTLGACIQEKVSNDLRAFCVDQGGTLFMGVLAVWNVLFYKYTEQTDFIIGTPTAGRNHDDLKNQIGCYINTMAVRSKINPDKSFIENFQQIKNGMLENYTHQDYPFDKIVDDLKSPMILGRNPVFDVMLTFHNIYETKNNVAMATTDKIFDLGTSKAKLDLLINALESEENIFFLIDFSTDIYEQSFVKQLVNNYKNLLNKLLLNPNKKLKDVDYQLELVRSFRKRNIQRLKSF